jgi:hypothetical protein
MLIRSYEINFSRKITSLAKYERVSEYMGSLFLNVHIELLTRCKENNFRPLSCQFSFARSYWDICRRVASVNSLQYLENNLKLWRPRGLLNHLSKVYLQIMLYPFVMYKAISISLDSNFTSKSVLVILLFSRNFGFHEMFWISTI